VGRAQIGRQRAASTHFTVGSLLERVKQSGAPARSHPQKPHSRMRQLLASEKSVGINKKDAHTEGREHLMFFTEI
jgi:hypothetical protein